jgi:hypothetical protein
MASKRQMYDYIIQYAEEHGLDTSGIPKPDTRQKDVSGNMPYDLYTAYVEDMSGNRQLIRRSVVKDMYDKLPKIHKELEVLLYKVEAIFQSHEWQNVDKEDQIRLLTKLWQILEAADVDSEQKEDGQL